jgi:AraC family transcriptional regulator
MATPARNPVPLRSPLAIRLQTDPAGVIHAANRPNPTIVIHVGRPVQIACDRGGLRHRGRSVHGDIDIVPAGFDSRWEVKDEDTALIIGVPAPLLRAAAEESRMPRRVEVLNRFQIRDSQLEHLGWAAKAEMESGYLNGNLYLESLAMAAAMHLLHRHSSQSRATPERHGGLSGYRLKQVLAYIDDRLGDRLALPDLAAVAGLRVSHFSASFRASTGQSVHRYVTARRVDRAQMLLRGGNPSISEVAAETGFAHASHLARHMRRLLGASPRSLRESLRESPQK